MHGHIADDTDIVRFPHVSNGNVPSGNDQLDKAGETILQLVARAAGVADDNSRQALGMAQKLSDQLRTAEDQIATLEADVANYRERAERAEEWLHRIYGEIEQTLLQLPGPRSAMNGAPHRPQARRAR
jgi:molecular chaperone GrpE (heat shock protein)